MKRITQITVCNFRAFYNKKNEAEKYQINLTNGENLLIYGENGSGKSSIFKAVEDFFRSANDSSISIQENFFTEGDLDLPPAEMRIKVSEKEDETKNWNECADIKLNKDDPTTFGNTILNDASKSFLTYRDILKTYFLEIENKANNPNLFELFVEILLSHIIDSSTNRYIIDDLNELSNKIENFEEELISVLNQPDEDEPEKTLEETKGKEQIEEDLLGQITEKINILNTSITFDLNEAIKKINHYLQNYFEANIIVYIKNVDHYLLLDHDKKLKRNLFLGLKYFDYEIEDLSYQSFLNEARLSALAISIYLAAAKSDNLTEDNLKILFLDDIFIGLDTSNRLPLLDILKDDFSPDFQIFITTYDRYWFETASVYLGSTWKKIELYNGEISKKEIVSGKEKEIKFFEIPVIIQDNLSLYKKAKKYFEAHDYYAAGNCLRKLFEERIEELTNITFHIEKDDLEGHIDKLSEYYKKCNCKEYVSDDLLKNLKFFKKILLNPSSHNDLKCPIYKLEVEKAFKVIDNLFKVPKINRILLRKMGSSLFYNNEEKNYNAEYVLTENLYGIELSNSIKKLSDPFHRIIRWEYDSVIFSDRDKNQIQTSEIKRIQSYEITCSARADRIKHFLNLPEIPNWETSFITNEGMSIISYFS